MHQLQSSMTIFDYLTLMLLVLGFILGFARGFFRELYVLIIWAAAFIIATIFTDPFSKYVSSYIDDHALAYLITFVLIFFVVWVVGSFLNLIVGIFLSATSVSFFSRVIGAMLGIVQGYAAALFLMFLIGNIPQEKYQWFVQAVSVRDSKPVLNWLHENVLSQTSDLNKNIKFK